MTGRKAAAPKPRYVVADDSLWLWGRLRDFDRMDLTKKDPSTLLTRMTEPMRADVRRLTPLVREFLAELEKSLEPR